MRQDKTEKEHPWTRLFSTAGGYYQSLHWRVFFTKGDIISTVEETTKTSGITSTVLVATLYSTVNPSQY